MSDIKYTADGSVKVRSRLNVRSGPSTSHSIVGKLYDGNKVSIVAKTSDSKFNDEGKMRGGYKIKYNGSYAYVCTNYVTVTKEYPEENPTLNTPNENVANTDYYILTGTAKTDVNLALDVRQLVNLQGLGNLLSGGYYVEEVELEISDKGLTQSIAVSKNAFRGSIK